MKWLRIAGQYINTGIVPQEGYRVMTQIKGDKSRFTSQEVQCLFGCRNSDSSQSFNLFFLSPWSDPTNTRFRADYVGTGSDTALKIDVSAMPYTAEMMYDISFGKTTTIGSMTTSTTASLGTPVQPIYMGSINTGGTADSRVTRMDYGEFTILNASGVEVFHGIPVPQGSTEFLATPAPSNCYYDTISKSYKVQGGGSGIIGFADDDRSLIEPVFSSQKDDYGLKALDDGEFQLEFMNSKYQLFGSDITNPVSQFKTYEITLAGYQTEPSPPYPGYVEDWNFYQGSGRVEREAITIDTGLPGDTIKALIVQFDGVQDANYQGRAFQYTTGITGNANNYLLPYAKTIPGYVNIPISGLSIVNGNTTTDIPMISGQGGQMRYNTLAQFNGGTLDAWYMETPQVKYRVQADGKIKIITSIPYNWIQRAGPNYRARWKDWVWFQGTKVRLTVLNTPYTL